LNGGYSLGKRGINWIKDQRKRIESGRIK